MIKFRNLIRPLAAAFALGLAGTSAHAQCSASAEANACPIKVNGNVVFDRCFGALPGVGRPTPVGNAICDGLRDSRRLVDAVGENNRQALQRTQADWEAFVKVATEGAIDRQAVQQLRSALGVAREIQAEVDTLLKDPQCGSKAALDGLQRRFGETVEMINGVGQVAGMTLDAVARLQPIVGELAKISSELNRLLESVKKKGGKAQTEYDALVRAVNDLQKDLTELMATDFSTVAAAGTSLATGVGPFVANCSGCAASLSAAIGSLGTGGTVTVGGAALCPETAGAGCVVGAIALPVGPVGAGVMTAISTGPCLAAANGMNSMGQHLQSIQRFVDGLVKLANSLPSSAIKAATAGQALSRLAAELGTEGQQSLRSIQASLNAMQPAFAAAANVVEDRIAPKVQSMAGTFVQNLGRDTALLGKCHGMIMETAANIGEDFVQAGATLVDAAQDMVNAGKVVNNLAEQGNDGLQAANRFTTQEWAAIDREMRRLSQRLWGVPFGTVDLPKTGTHLAGLAGNARERDDIIGDSAQLVKRTADLPGKALDAGKRAFLNQDKLTAQAKQGYDQGQAKVRKAAIAMAKSKADAKAKVAQAPKFAAVAQVPSVQSWPNARTPKLTTLTVVRQ